MTKLLHIGLGKCGSTFLQKEIFPKISKKLNINLIDLYNNSFVKLTSSKDKIHYLQDVENLERNLPSQFIISNEGLFSKGWEFSRIYESFNFIKNNFSSNTIILIVIRNPYDLLNSVYCQSIHKMKVIKPVNFFFNNKSEENIRPENKYNLYNFNYVELISLYKSYFKKVVVVKYENLKNLEFLTEIFDTRVEFLEGLNIDNKVYNKSISKYGVNFILFLNKFFNLNKYDQLIRGYLKPSKTILGRFKNKLLSQLLIKNFFQQKLDKVLIYKKYKIKKEYIPIDIDKEISKYNELNF